jgi:choline dehydrogenase-like flavoprotein
MVHKLETDNIGKAVSKVHATVSGKVTVFACDIIIIAAGATNSAALLLRTTSIHHPNRLSNNNELGII